MPCTSLPTRDPLSPSHTDQLRELVLSESCPPRAERRALGSTTGLRGIAAHPIARASRSLAGSGIDDSVNWRPSLALEMQVDVLGRIPWPQCGAHPSGCLHPKLVDRVGISLRSRHLRPSHDCHDRSQVNALHQK